MWMPWGACMIGTDEDDGWVRLDCIGADLSAPPVQLSSQRLDSLPPTPRSNASPMESIDGAWDKGTIQGNTLMFDGGKEVTLAEVSRTRARMLNKEGEDFI